MPFVLYIKLRSRHFLNVFVIICLLSGCSHTSDNGDSDTKPGSDTTNADDFKTLSKSVIDLVQIPSTNTDDLARNKNNDALVANTKNAYLAQTSSLMEIVPNTVIETYQQALKLMDEKQWLAAIALFDQVIAKQSDLSGSYVNKAIILKKLSDAQKGNEKTALLAKSELTVDKAISVNPLNPYAQHFKGQLLQQKGQFEQAEKHYVTALSIWPNYTQAQLSLAVLLELYRGELLEAYQYYTAYLTLKSEDKQVQRWQAALALKIKRAGLSLPVQTGE